MTVSFLVDEHVPRVFCTVLRSNGYEVVRARDVFGEGTDDEQLLAYCKRENHLLVTHDKKDFGTAGSDTHAGVVVYTDSDFLRDDPIPKFRRRIRVEHAFDCSDGRFGVISEELRVGVYDDACMCVGTCCPEVLLIVGDQQMVL